jgi:hypothetical protein
MFGLERRVQVVIPTHLGTKIGPLMFKSFIFDFARLTVELLHYVSHNCLNSAFLFIVSIPTTCGGIRMSCERHLAIIRLHCSIGFVKTQDLRTP